MTFAIPALIPLLIVAALFAAWSASHELRARRAARRALGATDVLDRVGVSDDPMRGRRIAFRSGAIIIAGVALLRPQWGTVDAEGVRSGRDILIALDLSRSMLVTDADGARLQQAKRAAWNLVSASPGDRIGLVIFGGAAFLQLPLTADLTTVQRFLDAANQGDIDDPATNVAAALHVAATTFAHEPGDGGGRAIILLSDGERSTGALDPALAELRKDRLPVFSVGLGTETGGFVPADTTLASDSGSRWHRDDVGRPVVSRLAAGDLQRITDGTGGVYARWDDRVAFSALAARLAALPRHPVGGQHRLEHAERFQWPLGLAVVLFGLELLGFPKARRRLSEYNSTSTMTGATRIGTIASAIFVTLTISSCTAYRHNTDLRRAAGLYGEGRWAEALALYQGALPFVKDPALRYDLGNAEYRTSRYRDALKHYREVLSEREELRSAALFNFGNANVRAAESAPEAEQTELYNRGITAFEELLRLNPDDQDAKWNLELAVRKRGDVNTGGSPGRGGRAQAGRGSGGEENLDADRQSAVGAMAGGGQGESQGESAEELDEDRARQLLETIERQQLENHEGRPAKTGFRVEHDW
ncbi:MAG: VWA domain-containing protein [Gemmatimonadota bacterium]